MENITISTYKEWIDVAAFYIFLQRGTDDALAAFGVVKPEFGDALSDWLKGQAEINRKLQREQITVE